MKTSINANNQEPIAVKIIFVRSSMSQSLHFNVSPVQLTSQLPVA